MKYDCIFVAALAVLASPISAQEVDWTGFYLGAQAGRGTNDREISGPLTLSDPTSDDSQFGIHAGYLFDQGDYVIGVEADYSVVDLGLSDRADDHLARVKGMVGYDSGVFLPYVTIGLARLFDGPSDTIGNGVFFGAGAMYQAAPHIRVGGEVLKHRFERDIPILAAFVGETPTITTDAVTVSFKVSYAF